MAPKQARRAVAKAKAQAKAAAAAAVARKVAKKKLRRAALQALNGLAEEVGAGAAQVDPRTSRKGLLFAFHWRYHCRIQASFERPPPESCDGR